MMSLDTSIKTECNTSIKTECNTSAYLKLINLVKGYPILYENNGTILDSHILRQNQKEINQCWQLIATELCIPVGECKKRWKTLKETFFRVYKRNLQQLQDPTKQKWFYEDAMSFLTHSQNNKEQKPKKLRMDNIIQMDPNSEEVENGTVEYIELDMDSMGDSEYYIMDASVSSRESPGEIIQITTPQQINQMIVNNKSVPKYITICNNSQNVLQNATIVNINDLDKNNFIISTGMSEDENSEYILNDIIENDDEVSINGEDADSNKDNKNFEELNISNKCQPLNNEILKRINELLYSPGNEKGLDSFFQNIKQAILQLPKKVQAEVKMEILNIISKAEVIFLQRNIKLK